MLWTSRIQRKKVYLMQFSGHTRENCYKLIGYPNDWKQRQKNNYNNGGSGGYNQGYGRINGHENQYSCQLNSHTNFTDAGHHDSTGHEGSK